MTAYDSWAIRRAVNVAQWDAFGHLIAKDRFDPKGYPPDPTWAALLPELRETGMVRLPVVAGQISLLRDWFAPLPTGAGPHIYSGANKYYSCYPSGYVIRSPLLPFMNDPKLLGLVELYMECWPTLYSMNVWWSNPAPEPQLDHMQRFHRDRDDWRFLCLFIYGTDVDEEHGPHQMIRGSHRTDVTGKGEAFDKACEANHGEQIQTVTGKAGTCFLVNTIALHRGLPPKAGPRLIAWGRYGLGPNINSYDLEGGPIAARVIPHLKPLDNVKGRYINRLLLDFDSGPHME
jgi:hypothetical protein